MAWWQAFTCNGGGGRSSRAMSRVVGAIRFSLFEFSPSGSGAVLFESTQAARSVKSGRLEQARQEHEFSMKRTRFAVRYLQEHEPVTAPIPSFTRRVQLRGCLPESWGGCGVC